MATSNSLGIGVGIRNIDLPFNFISHAVLSAAHASRIPRLRISPVSRPSAANAALSSGSNRLMTSLYASETSGDVSFSSLSDIAHSSMSDVVNNGPHWHAARLRFSLRFHLRYLSGFTHGFTPARPI